MLFTRDLFRGRQSTVCAASPSAARTSVNNLVGSALNRHLLEEQDFMSDNQTRLAFYKQTEACYRTNYTTHDIITQQLTVVDSDQTHG